MEVQDKVVGSLKYYQQQQRCYVSPNSNKYLNISNARTTTRT